MQFNLYESNEPQKSIYAPRSSESHVDVSVPVTFVANVDADSVDVLIVVSAVDAIEDPITITFHVMCVCVCAKQMNKIYGNNFRKNEYIRLHL